MKIYIRKTFYYLGIAMIFAATLRYIFDMLSFKEVDFWTIISCLGFIFLSIGMKNEIKKIEGDIKVYYDYDSLFGVINNLRIVEASDHSEAPILLLEGNHYE